MKRFLATPLILAAFVSLQVFAPPIDAQRGVRTTSAAQGGGGGALLDWGGTSYQPLEITQPRSDLPSAHRMLHAYIGLSYEVRIAAIGGVYPYRYELVSGAPAGMAISATAGTITWPNPTSSTGTITIRVTDTKSVTDTETFSITVGTSPFKFVDAVNGKVNASGGTGTIGNPWRTLADAIEHTAPSDIVYFKTGTYNFAGIDFASADGGGARVAGLYIEAGPASHNKSSAIWLAYPGQSPIFDHSYKKTISTAYMIDLFGDGTSWFEGIEFWDTYWKFIAINSGATTFYKNEFHGHNGQISNGSMLMWSHSRGYTRNVVQNNEFHNEDATLTPNKGLGILLYDNDKMLIEGNTFTSMAGAFSPKDSAAHFTIRGNSLTTFPNGHCLESNFNAGVYTTSGDIGFNLFNGAFGDTFAGCITIGVSAISPIGQIAVYRNTIRGDVKFGSSPDNSISADDGPFPFVQNVIVNENSGASPYTFFIRHPDFSRNPFDWKRVADIDNLKGKAAAGIIDANGLLQGSYRSNPAYLYYRGHEVP